MSTPPVSNNIIARAESFISQGTSTLSSLTAKWFAKKDVREEVVADTARLQRRRNSIIQTYSPEEMKGSVEKYGEALDTSRFKLALEKFEKAQEDLSAAESEESLSARRLKMASAHEELKTEFNQLNVAKIKEKRLSEVREKALKQGLVVKALRVREFYGNCPEMAHLECVIESDPELATILLDAHLALIRNKSS